MILPTSALPQEIYYTIILRASAIDIAQITSLWNLLTLVNHDKSILQQLDSLDTHIKKHGEMKSYVPITQVEVDSSNPDQTRDLAVSSNNEIDSVNGKVNSSDQVDLIDEMASLRSLLEGLIGAIAMNAQSGLPGRKKPSDVLFIQDALYKAVERDYLLSGEQVKQIGVLRDMEQKTSLRANSEHNLTLREESYRARKNPVVQAGQAL